MDAAVSQDDIDGTYGSVPGMAAAASSLPSSGEAPQAGECAQAVATCNIDANQNQAPAESKTSKAKTAKHVLITLSLPNPSSENPIDSKMPYSLLQKRAVLHAMVQGSLMETFMQRGYRYQVYRSGLNKPKWTMQIRLLLP